MAKKKPKSEAPTIENRKARHDFEIVETLECGVMLQGSEVKSIRNGAVSLGEGFVRAEESPPALYLHQVNISPYQPAGPLAHEPARTRRLLAHKAQILKFVRAVDGKGMTIVPLKMYFKDGFVKVLIGLARGKSHRDRRQDIAKRDAQRDIDRAMARKTLRG